MILKIPDLLTADQLTWLRSQLAGAEFVDGKLTAGWYAKQVKHNQQLQASSSAKELRNYIRQALEQNDLLQAAVRPRQIHSILISRYGPGMSYGRHTDNALMSVNGTLLRSDVSFTVFLSAPDTYEGGELVIEGADDEQSYKLDAGAALVYPATTLHRVEPVLRGDRLVAVGWVQSLIRDAGQREILFDLDTARRSLYASQGKSPEFDLISKSLANLVRQWAD